MIERSKQHRFYTTVHNHIIRGGVLTLEELGLYTAMLSRPDNWEFSEYVLSRDFHTTPDDIHRVLKRLESKGYVRERTGRNGRVWDLYEESTLCVPNTATHFETASKRVETAEATSEGTNPEADKTAPKSNGETGEDNKRTLTNEQMANVFFERANELRRIRDEYRKTHVWP